MSGTIQRSLRPYDLVVRFGGDEFVCAVVDADRSLARQRFQEIQGELRHADPPASISVGLAELRPDDTLQTLTERADADLYVAKRTP